MNVDRPGRRMRMPWEPREKVDVHRRDDTSTLVSRRVKLPFLQGAAKNHFVAMLAEFVGTFLFLLFAFGGTNAVNNSPGKDQGNLNSDPARLLYISLCFGMSLAVNAVCVFPRCWSQTGIPSDKCSQYHTVGLLPHQRWTLQPGRDTGHDPRRRRHI